MSGGNFRSAIENVWVLTSGNYWFEDTVIELTVFSFLEPCISPFEFVYLVDEVSRINICNTACRYKRDYESRLVTWISSDDISVLSSYLPALVGRHLKGRWSALDCHV